MEMEANRASDGQEPTSSKKPRLGGDEAEARADFQVGYKVFDRWATDAENALEQVQSLGNIVRLILPLHGNISSYLRSVRVALIMSPFF